MRFRKTLLSLFFTAALAVGAFADEPAGSEGNPYKGEVKGLNPNNAGAGNTIYIDGMTAGYWTGGGHGSYFFSANIVIGEGGMVIDNGGSDCKYTFSGTISGTGNWRYDGSRRRPVVQHYTFIGDWSGYAGDVDFSSVLDLPHNHTYFHFGNGEHAAPSDTNVAGSGSISVNGIIAFNYSGYADVGTDAITIGNTLISASALEFAGTVNYVVTGELKGYAGATLTISNEGKTSLCGEVSGFGTVSVAGSSTLEIGGATSLSSPIENAGKVVLKESVVFALDNLPTTEDGAYIVIEGKGGSIEGDPMVAKNFSLGGTTLSDKRTTTIAIEEGTLTVSIDAAELIWNGTSDDNAWTVGSTNWEGAAFHDNDKVIFDETAEIRTASIVNDVSAKATTVCEDYTFEFTGDATATSANLTFGADGTALTLAGEGTFCLGNEKKEPALVGIGRIEVCCGATLRLFPNTQGEYDDEDVMVRVRSGGTLDVNGSGDTTFSVVLDGGTLTSSAENKELTGWKQLPKITLTENSIVDTANELGMVGSGFGKTNLFLCGNTLEKAGTGVLFLTSTKVSEGTIHVTYGTLTLRDVAAQDATIDVGTVAQLRVAKSPRHLERGGDGGRDAQSSVASATGDCGGESVIGELKSDGEIVIEGGSVLELVGNSTIAGAVVIDVKDSVGSLRVAKGANLTLNVYSVSSTGTLALSEGSTLTLDSEPLTMERGKVAFDTGATLVLTDKFLESYVGAGAVPIISATEIKFGDTKLEGSKAPKNLDKLIAPFVSCSESYKLKWSFNNGVLYAEITR